MIKIRYFTIIIITSRIIIVFTDSTTVSSKEKIFKFIYVLFKFCYLI